MTIRYPQPLKFHKKTAQLQVDLVKPKEDDGGRIKSGCLFLALAKAKGDGTEQMDWANKINIKLDPIDISKIVTGVRSGTPVKLFHKSEKAGSVTTLNVEAGNPGSFKWFISKSVGDQKNMGNIYLDSGDMYHMFTMFEAALPVISGWVE